MNIKKNKTIIILIFLFIIIVLIAIKLIPPALNSLPKTTPKASGQNQNASLESTCKKSGGIWQKDYKECEGPSSMLSEKECLDLGGKYFSCESPCRHDPKAEMCIALCIKVCKF
jgi:hypothetical protein